MDYFTINKLKSDDEIQIIHDYRHIPKKLIDNILENEDNYEDDVYTPMEKGPDWLYEELEIYQPQTASLLKNSPIYLCHDLKTEVYDLFQVINDRIISIIRRPYGCNPCDEAYDETGSMILWKSLPEALQKAYFYKFKGLEMFLGNIFHLRGFQLINWNGRPLGTFLGEIKKEKYREKCYEFFNMGPKYIYSEPYSGDIPHYDDGHRLWPFLEHFHQKPYDKNHDYLCILRDNEKSPIYYFKDGNLENLYEIPRDTISEAMDNYHYHILSGAENRFQFLEYAHEVKEWKS